ncbi:MAG: ParB N-terminal domain-containing protein [Chloroflexota bacterium]
MPNRNETDIPDLRIVPAQAITLHEEVDERRVKPLVEKLSQDGVLKNPPIAARLPQTDRYVILDGANRTTALWKMEAAHHLLQVVNYTDVTLDTWDHLIVGLTEAEFQARRKEVGLWLIQTDDLASAQRDLANRRVSAILSAPQGDVCVLGHGGNLAAEAADLRQLVSIYSGRSAIHRVKVNNLAELLPYYDNITALIQFPRYTPTDILTLANDGDKLPTGITRHVIPRRALRVNLPLAALMDPQSGTADKQHWLNGWIKEKLAKRQIRYYQESTFLFDE